MINAWSPFLIHSLLSRCCEGEHIRLLWLSRSPFLPLCHLLSLSFPKPFASRFALFLICLHVCSSVPQIGFFWALCVAHISVVSDECGGWSVLMVPLLLVKGGVWTCLGWRLPLSGFDRVTLSPFCFIYLSLQRRVFLCVLCLCVLFCTVWIW